MVITHCILMKNINSVVIHALAIIPLVSTAYVGGDCWYHEICKEIASYVASTITYYVVKFELCIWLSITTYIHR